MLFFLVGGELKKKKKSWRIFYTVKVVIKIIWCQISWELMLLRSNKFGLKKIIRCTKI